MPSGHVIIIIPSIVYTKNGLLEDGIEKKNYETSVQQPLD